MLMVIIANVMDAFGEDACCIFIFCLLFLFYSCCLFVCLFVCLFACLLVCCCCCCLFSPQSQAEGGHVGALGGGGVDA